MWVSSPLECRAGRALHRDDTGLGSAVAITEPVVAFIETLEAGQRKAASFAWDGAEWRSWNYFGVGGFIKPGLRLEQMRPNQKEAAWRALAAVLSPAGLEKAKTVMLLQDILAAQGNGSGQRSAERFSVSVFGTPAATGAWGLRLEGHHLTYSVSVRDGAIILGDAVGVFRSSKPRDIGAARGPRNLEG